MLVDRALDAEVETGPLAVDGSFAIKVAIELDADGETVERMKVLRPLCDEPIFVDIAPTEAVCEDPPLA